MAALHGAVNWGVMIRELECVAVSPRTSNRRGRSGTPGSFPRRVCLAQHNEEKECDHLCTCAHGGEVNNKGKNKF